MHAGRRNRFRLAVAAALTPLLFCALGTAADGEVKRHSFNIASVISYYQYKEPTMPISFKGPMVGVSAEYINRGLFSVGCAPSFLALQSTYMMGRTDYDGFVMDTGQKFKTKDIHDSYIETRALVGLTFTPAWRLEVTPYVGFGNRYLVNRWDKKDRRGFRRTSTYWYVPIGVTVTKNLRDDWSVSLNAEYDWFLRGRQTQRVSDVVPGGGSIGVRQHKGHGFKVSVKLEKRFCRVSAFVEPYMSIWNVAQSEVVDGAHEPRNRTNEVGVKVGIGF